jgi:hypothetical protein
MTQLPLNDVEWDAFVGELDGVGRGAAGVARSGTALRPSRRRAAVGALRYESARPRHAPGERAPLLQAIDGLLDHLHTLLSPVNEDDVPGHPFLLFHVVATLLPGSASPHRCVLLAPERGDIGVAPGAARRLVAAAIRAFRRSMSVCERARRTRGWCRGRSEQLRRAASHCRGGTIGGVSISSSFVGSCEQWLVAESPGAARSERPATGSLAARLRCFAAGASERGLRAERPWKPEVSEDAGVGEPSDRRDRVALEREHDQPIGASDGRVRVR